MKRSTIVPKKHEEALFSLQFTIVLIEHLKVISRVLHVRHAMTINEYCTLLLLDSLKEDVSSLTLAKYLVYQRGTTLAILASLEQRGFIEKHAHPLDGRAMLVRQTALGHTKAKQIAQEVNSIMNELFWRSLPAREYLAPLNEQAAQLDNLRGFTMDSVELSKRSSGLIHALLFRGISLVVDRWVQVVKQCSGLAFSEARALLLLEHYGLLAPSEIAGRLHIERSSVSLGIKHLGSLGLVEPVAHETDKRSRMFRCTSKGLALSRELFSALRKSTSDAFNTYSDDAIIALNIQHMHMYSDIKEAIYHAKNIK